MSNRYDISKPERKLLKEILKLGSGLNSPPMLSDNLSLKLSTINRRLQSLEKRNIVTSSECVFHDGTKIYSVSRDIELFIS